MKLYLVRHAAASDIAPSDAERELTKEGREEARVAGAALVKLGAKPTQMLTSPLARARQTADIIAEQLAFDDEVAVFNELCNGRSTAVLVSALRQFEGARSMLLVGHMPSLADHLAVLIGAGNTAGLSFGKGSVACVEMAELAPGKGELRWLLRTKQLRLLA